MTPNMPYLLRAFYEWLLDNDLTPHIVIDAMVEGTLVPQEHVKDGQIVLNISPTACSHLQIGNVDVTFEARFGGVPQSLVVPCKAIQAIYARENGAGTVFTHEENDEETHSEATSRPAPEPSKPAKKGSHLKVVK